MKAKSILGVEIDIIYYQLWSREHQRLREEKYALDVLLSSDYKKTVYLNAVDIPANNLAFLEELDQRIPDGKADCVWWLRGLISEYVRRCALQSGDDYQNEILYFNDWIENTLWIIGSKYPEITKWCREYLQMVKDLKSKGYGAFESNKQSAGKSVFPFSYFLACDDSEKIIITNVSHLIILCKKGFKS